MAEDDAKPEAGDTEDVDKSESTQEGTQDAADETGEEPAETAEDAEQEDEPEEEESDEDEEDEDEEDTAAEETPEQPAVPSEAADAAKEERALALQHVISNMSHKTLNYLDTLDDAELVTMVENMETELRHFKLENLVFEHFLQKNDPLSVTALSSVGVVQSVTRVSREHSDTLTAAPSFTSGGDEASRSASRAASRIIRASLFALAQETKGPRINLTQKTDLVLREMEETQSVFQAFVKKSHRQKCNLVAELEEISIRKGEIQEARDIFEQTVVIEGLDPLTQRIPAEKFVRYMEEWLKSAQAILEKVRLRVSTFKQQYKKVSNQLTQKQELGETLHAVDFEQLQIENKHFLEKIDQKNAHLLELKKMNGTANLVLSKHKQYLQKQMEDLKTIKNEIKLKEKKVEDLDKESEEAEAELSQAQEKFENVKEMVQSYRVPDVMEYIKKKATLYDLKKNLKIWSRRLHIQDIALKSCIREMKNLTGAQPSPSWFKLKSEYSDELLFIVGTTKR